MAPRNLSKKETRGAITRSPGAKSLSAEPVQKNGKEELEQYIEEFVTNGLKLQQELMINHEAIEAARREYHAEFRRKRDIGR